MWALIAGSGALPDTLVEAAETRPLVCALQGMGPDRLSVDITFRIEQLGSFLSDLKARGVDTLCLAGGVQRPEIDQAAIDAETAPLVPVITGAMTSGDDGALRAILQVLQEAGFAIRAAHDIAPEILMPTGVPTQAQPDETAQADAARAETVVAAMGAADIGQSCAVKSGMVLATEGIFGTDWMLDSLAARPDGQGGLFYKAPKPGQDRRADLPTIGPATVEAVAKAGLNGIVIDAGGVIVLNRMDVIAACDQLGLYLWVRTCGSS